MHCLDIDSRSDEKLARQLSNFTDRSFLFDGIPCASIESVLQACKTADPTIQKVLCGKTAKNARLQKEALDKVWQKTQRMHWQGRRYDRNSQQYVELITRLYDAAFAETATGLADQLRESLPYQLTHSIGLTDQRKTALTEVEFLYQLYRLRTPLYVHL